MALDDVPICSTVIFPMAFPKNVPVVSIISATFPTSAGLQVAGAVPQSAQAKGGSTGRHALGEVLHSNRNGLRDGLQKPPNNDRMGPPSYVCWFINHYDPH